MKYVIDHDLHIHSQYSPCAGFDPRQTTERILQYALENGLSEICVTDHFWDAAVPGAENSCYGTLKLDYEQLAKALPLPRHEKVKFYFGCETEMDQFFQVGIARETIDKFDFVIIPTTHLHFEDFTIAHENDAPKRRTELYLQRLDALFNMDLPFHKIGIAHLTTSLIAPVAETSELRKETMMQMIDAITDVEFTRVFRKAAEKGVGIELNFDRYDYETEQFDRILRPYHIAKNCGCKFYFGSDAHTPEGFVGQKEGFETIVELLQLEEKDKFHFGQ